MERSYKRKLTMPPSHIPYLEKHRIYELFHELGRELVIQQPVDHVVFLKQILSKAAQSRDVSRVILLGCSKINITDIANKISEYTRQIVVTEETILNASTNKDRSSIRAKDLTKYLSRLLHTTEMVERGWILSDCIRTVKEARLIVEAGILPTHVFHLISPYYPPMNELLYCHVPEGWPEYRRMIMGIRNIFSRCLLEVFLLDKSFVEIAEECVDLIRIKKSLDAPQRLRILLIGPRGSGRKTQAKLLCEHFDLIHVDFEYLFCATFISETPLGEQLKAFKEKACFQSDLLVEIINKRILDSDCLKQGWVITGFPFTVFDLKFLDCIDTPPNRIIFLECNLNVCTQRLINRKVNIYTGSITNLLENRLIELGKIVTTHPKDEKEIVTAELNYYCENYGSLRKYCGKSANVVNADQQKKWVFESILAILDQAPPVAPPRNPYESDEKLSEIPTCSCNCKDANNCCLHHLND